MSTPTISTQQEKVAPISKLWWVGLVAAGAAALGNLVFYFIARGLGVSFIMPAGPGSTEMAMLPAMTVIMASVMPTVVATIVYAILGKFLSRPIRTFWIISVIIFVVWSILPFVILPATVERSTVFGLEVMHIIAAVAIVGLLTTLGRE